MQRLLASGSALALAISCGPIDQSGTFPRNDGGVGDQSPPAIEVRIVSPGEGKQCHTDDRGDCAISVAVIGAALAPRGACSGRAACGHLELYIDGTACGSPNVESSSDGMTAHFGRCGKPEGSHVLACELRDDQGALLARSQEVRTEVKRDRHDDDGGDDHGEDDNRGNDGHGGDNGDHGGHG